MRSIMYLVYEKKICRGKTLKVLKYTNLEILVSYVDPDLPGSFRRPHYIHIFKRIHHVTDNLLAGKAVKFTNSEFQRSVWQVLR